MTVNTVPSTFDPPADGPLNLPAVEQEVMAFWSANDIVRRFTTARSGGDPWVTYEGPPTVNGAPALHHVWTSTYKDVYARFHALRGRFVYRIGGWDCQGLPVEIAVEKQLGLTHKQDIEAYGVEGFVRACREMVEKNIAKFRRVFERIGYWADFDNAYRTMDDKYLESVWWHLKRLWDKGLVYEGVRVVPYCTRCGTVLSTHEMGQPGVYRQITDDAAHVGFRLAGSDRELVVWTTTPWTLPANVAVAVDPERAYGVYRWSGRELIVAVEAAERVLPDAELIETITGADLVGLEYERPYPEPEASGGRSAIVVPWPDGVSDTGSGLVHIAPAFGEEDAALGAEHGLAVLNPVDGAGRFVSGPFAGEHVLDAVPAVLEDLRRRGRLVRTDPHDHSYPHCWRCRSPLIYWAKPTWFIRTTDVKDRFVEENDQVAWYPNSVKSGRFGNWLSENVDWAVARDRYWGTPMPIWRCPNGHARCVGDRAELSRLSGTDLGDVSLHRPEVDDIVVPCPDCGAEARRISAVCDVWLDSGCMPAAQWAYPAAGSDRFSANYPADFVCEAIDQTRGWFYSLLAVGVMVFDSVPYENVVCLGHLVDDEGRKMSKSLGNVIDPEELIPRFGADGVRWYLLGSGAPWNQRRVSIEAIGRHVGRDLGTLWNVASFYRRYARVTGFVPSGAPGERAHVLDRWIMSRLDGLIETVTAQVEGYQAHAAAQELTAFIDELSNWYVRRGRRRYYTADDLPAFQTLYEVLRTVVVLLAPFCPFYAEAIFQQLRGESDAESVHLASWPTPLGVGEPGLDAEMATSRRVASLVRAARTRSGIPVRQPLREARVLGIDELPDVLRSLIEDESNVGTLTLGADTDIPMRYELRPNWRRVGPRYRDEVDRIARWLSEHASAELVARLRDGRQIEFTVDGVAVVLEPDDVTIGESIQAGWLSANADGLTVVLDTNLDEELRNAFHQRTLLRRIQTARRAAGLDICDRIVLWLDADGIDRDRIAEEVLAVKVHPLADAPGDDVLVRDDGFAFVKA